MNTKTKTGKTWREVDGKWKTDTIAQDYDVEEIPDKVAPSFEYRCAEWFLVFAAESHISIADMIIPQSDKVTLIIPRWVMENAYRLTQDAKNIITKGEV